MMLLHGFPPVAASDAHTLILGSMPGAASLSAHEYYAHPRNAFWPIMGALFGARPEWPYERRLERLTQAGIALWDVIGACERPGSLDAGIVPASVQVNDFAGFLAVHRRIGRIFFNGSAAETLFRRHVRPTLPGLTVPCMRLPSTSPAHAARGLADKMAAWAVVGGVAGDVGSGSV